MGRLPFGGECALSIRPHSQALAHSVRVEPEDAANAFEGARPVCLLGEEPLLCLVEEPTAVSIRGEAILLNAIERVVKDGDHEPLLGYLRAPRREVLRRQNGVDLRHTRLG